MIAAPGGEREDISGKEVTAVLSALPAKVHAYCIVPDEKRDITAAIIEFVDVKRLDLVITTGGTGVSPRDVTPDATIEVLDKEIPGMAEVMRRESEKKNTARNDFQGGCRDQERIDYHQSAGKSARRKGKSGNPAARSCARR